MFNFDKNNVQVPLLKISKPVKNLNAILIVLDQALSYKLLPKEILKYLPGYQAFRKIGIDLTNSFCSRTPCTASRAVIQTGCLNTGIQDTIYKEYQVKVFPWLNPAADTIAKTFKINNYNTAYFGKYHLDFKFFPRYSDLPIFNINTRGSLKVQGFDQFNTIGDFEPDQHGMLSDTLILQSVQSPNSMEYDYFDKSNNFKLNGIIPFLKKRGEDRKQFYTEIHLTNPHDIVYSRSDLSQELHGKTFLQFWYPFCKEQIEELNITNPYYFNKLFQDAFIKNSNLTTNFFEKTYEEYSSNVSSLPFKESLFKDFVTDPINNGINPLFVANYKLMRDYSTVPDSQHDTKGWKNLINTYYGLFIEVDSYIYKIFLELKKQNLLGTTNVILTSDHGEAIGGHGQRNKSLPFNEQTNIIGLVYSPNILPKYRGTKSDYINSSIDIFKTFMDINNLQIKTPINKEQLRGESLFIKNKQGFFIPKTTANNPNKNVLLIYNGNEGTETYSYYKEWFQTASIQTRKRIIGTPPPNIFCFQPSFIFVQTVVNTKLYKFGYYYSLLDVLLFNYNQNNLSLSKNNIIDNIPKTSTTNFTAYLNSLSEPFSVSDLLSYVYLKEGTDNDTFNLYAIICATFKYLYSCLKVFNKAHLLYIPFFNASYSNKTELNVSMLCYNETDDKEETTNLLDLMNYSSSNDELFDQLNERLIISMEEQKVNPLLTIIPYDTYIEGVMNVLQDTVNVLSEEFYTKIRLLTLIDL
jgi:arylsulfatase A-like enzyme